ncbi:MAG: hypothetical protein LBE62_05115 [Azonexus sp.]|jgi:hypothetical protein|nr:hypothetical protein [Azonexus sp.]
MKRLLIVGAVAGALFSQPGFTQGPNIGSSELSVASILFPSIISGISIRAYFRKLSEGSTPIKVDKVEPKENNKTLIKGEAKGEHVEFEIDSHIAKDANIKENDDVFIRDAKLGYVLECNNIALGIVSMPENEKNFQREKLN